jgi:thiol-disulfide isomerase/thioredoxin
MKMKYLFLLLIVPFLNPITLHAQNRAIVFEQGAMADVLSKAGKENKLVFVDCFTVWCGPCKGMDKFVFTNDTVADFFNSNFINVKMDMEKGEGIAMGNKYKVGAFPTYLLLDGSGNVVYKFVGGMTADSFLITIKQGMDPKNRVASMNSEYQKGNRSKAFLREYVKLKIEMKEIESGQKIASDYFKLLTPNERTKPDNWYLFGENRYSLYLSNIYSSNFNYLAENWKGFVKENGKETVESKLAKSYRQIAEYCLNGWYFKKQPYNKKDFERYRKQLKKTELVDKKQLISMMNVAQAAGEKDTVAVINLLADNIADFSEENKRILFGFVTMLNSRAPVFTKNKRCKEIFDKVIQTSTNEGLVRTAKSYQGRFSEQ